MKTEGLPTHRCFAVQRCCAFNRSSWNHPTVIRHTFWGLYCRPLSKITLGNVISLLEYEALFYREATFLPFLAWLTTIRLQLLQLILTKR